MTAEPFSADIWDERELWPRERIAEYQLERLQRQLAVLASESAFYRARFAGLGWNPAELRRLEDIEALPFTRKTDYLAALEAAPPWGSLLAVPPGALRRLHFSSGTTARPTPDAWTERDLERWADLYARLAYSQGVRASDVFQCLFNLSWFVGGLGAMAALQRLGAVCIPAGSGDSERQLHTLFAYGAAAVCATPSFALYLAEVAADLGLDLSASRVRVIMAGGEPGAAIPATRAKIEALWGARCFDAYGSLEFQPIAWDCSAQAGAHLVEDFAYAEVVDPQSGRPLPDGQPGVLVLTHLDKEAFPLLRWWTGDVVLRDSAPCACGRRHARLLGGVRGRADDMLVIRGVNLFPSAVEDVLRGQPGVTGEFIIVLDDQVRDSETGLLAALKLRLEAGPEAPSDLAARLAGEIRSRLQVRSVIELVAPGSLPRTTHKAKRILRLGG